MLALEIRVCWENLIRKMQFGRKRVIILKEKPKERIFMSII